MSIDRNIVIKLHKSGESNSEIAKTAQNEPHNCLEDHQKFQEIGTILDRESRGQKQTVCTPQLIKKTREKLQRNCR